MSDRDDASTVRLNAEYWEALAPDRLGEPVEFFRDGGSALTHEEWAAIGDVRGRRALQLAAAVGDEAITLAQHGAHATAVDIAPSHLATGRRKAAELGLEVDFVEADMMSLDPALTGFDVVLISSGGICWVTDLDAWSASVARRLNPGGRLVIGEHHPLWEVLTVEAPDRLRVSGDYFDPSREGYGDPTKAPVVTRQAGIRALPSRSFVWNLGRIVTALVGAGLAIRSLEEMPQPEMFEGLGDAAHRIPATYLLVAERSAGHPPSREAGAQRIG